MKFKTVDEYISVLPAGSKAITKELRKKIKEEIPKGEHVISYNIPAVKLNGKAVIHFATWKEHISLYPSSAAMEASVKGLSDYIESKATIKFPLDKPLPYGLISKILKFRMKELSEKESLKKKK